MYDHNKIIKLIANSEYVNSRTESVPYIHILVVKKNKNIELYLCIIAENNRSVS